MRSHVHSHLLPTSLCGSDLLASSGKFRLSVTAASLKLLLHVVNVYASVGGIYCRRRSRTAPQPPDPYCCCCSCSLPSRSQSPRAIRSKSLCLISPRCFKLCRYCGRGRKSSPSVGGGRAEVDRSSGVAEEEAGRMKLRGISASFCFFTEEEFESV